MIILDHKLRIEWKEVMKIIEMVHPGALPIGEVLTAGVTKK